MSTWDDIFILIARAQTGDRAAFGELVERFHPAVYAVALARLRDSNEANDLAQEVFIHAMTKIDQLRDPHCFVGWLRQITVRMAINRVTRKGPVQATEPEFMQNAPDAEGGPLDTLIKSENRTAVWSGLDRLKPMDRDTLVAFYIKGRSLKQMSRDFETPVGTIKRRLHVARNRLRQAMEKGTARRQMAAV
jgi:RNA polymerase sigma-70 factor (ECF subfamily)